MKTLHLLKKALIACFKLKKILTLSIALIWLTHEYAHDDEAIQYIPFVIAVLIVMFAIKWFRTKSGLCSEKYKHPKQFIHVFVPQIVVISAFLLIFLYLEQGDMIHQIL